MRSRTIELLIYIYICDGHGSFIRWDLKPLDEVQRNLRLVTKQMADADTFRMPTTKEEVVQQLDKALQDVSTYYILPPGSWMYLIKCYDDVATAHCVLLAL